MGKPEFNLGVDPELVAQDERLGLSVAGMGETARALLRDLFDAASEALLTMKSRFAAPSTGFSPGSEA